MQPSAQRLIRLHHNSPSSILPGWILAPKPSMSSSSPRDPTIGVHPRRELFEHNLLPISRKP
ncbi:hypothetical protein JHK87_006469 [Glycine soja]|nr:hypothetical protein JHK87_006469 [Glycine soja]